MRKRPASFEVTVDGRQVTAVEGESVLVVARRAGVEIPTLCHLEGLTPVGSCRLCLVEIAGQPGLRPACATLVSQDMDVRTDTERLNAHRRMILEMVFAEGNHTCSVCVSTGNCELQRAAATVGLEQVSLRYAAPHRAVDASHPRYVHDPNRCILCTRCVRACDEIEGAHVWDVAHRGENATVVVDLGGRWGDSLMCTQCGKCVAVCPTGALFVQHDVVGSARHDPDLVTRLATARGRRQWILPEPAPADGDGTAQAASAFRRPRATVGPLPGAGAGRPRLATIWLGGCAGCHMSLLDLDEALIDLTAQVDLVYGPLVDVKEFPEDVDVVLVEGAVANEENLELAHQLRARSRIVVSLGSCAVDGNVTAMRNPLGDPRGLLERVYVEAVARDGVVPTREVPRLLPQVLPLNQVIPVDLSLHGCPPGAPEIAEALAKALALAGKEVCGV